MFHNSRSFGEPLGSESDYPLEAPNDIVGPSFQGAGYYMANNPPYGAVFTYYMKSGLKTRKETRQAAEKELAKKNACTACHAIDKKLVGPGYKDVANKYRADKGAEASLIEKVKKGGVGAWGQVPMPPNAQVKDEDVKAIVKWILSLK